MNHWSDCIDNWHGASFGQGDLNVFLGSCMAWAQGLKFLYIDT